MNPHNTLNVKNRGEWRKWLSSHFETSDEIWLVLPKKSSGVPRISYNDAVEEALCFGWIDSTAKSLDEHHSIQRFTPRRPRSSYSQANKERLRWLDGRDMLHPRIREAVKSVLEEEFVFPEDIVSAIRDDAQAWKYYVKFSQSYKRIRVAYIDGARDRPEEFQKRLSNFIEKTRNNKTIGYGGIDKFF